MIHNMVRVVLAAVWLTVGAGLLLRHLLPPEWFAARDGMTLNLMGLVAVVLAVYNVLRLVTHIRRQMARARVLANPLARPRVEPPAQEYIPELDFTKNAADEKAKPDGERPA